MHYETTRIIAQLSTSPRADQSMADQNNAILILGDRIWANSCVTMYVRNSALFQRQRDSPLTQQAKYLQETHWVVISDVLHS